jgi:formimidoylglutamate deiminase
VETALSATGATGTSSQATRKYLAPLAWLPGGWARDVAFTIDDRGSFGPVTPESKSAGATRIDGVMLPGMINAHSHAFQRAMVGLTHRAGSVASGGADNFWSWRSLMYALALRLTPEQVEAIACWVYTEMLRGGYTHVCEFHYLHNHPDGRPYADPAELSRAVLRAAERAGIGITLLPVLYMTSGFGGTAPRDEQRRFLSTPERLLDVVARSQPRIATIRAWHSASRRTACARCRRRARRCGARLRLALPDAPIHIHIAEQTGEVDACVAWSGKRPVEWLLSTKRSMRTGTSFMRRT